MLHSRSFDPTDHLVRRRSSSPLLALRRPQLLQQRLKLSMVPSLAKDREGRSSKGDAKKKEWISLMNGMQVGIIYIKDYKRREIIRFE